MTAIRALSELKNLGLPVFRTADAATLLKMHKDAANKMLSRLNEAGLIRKIIRGFWCFPGTDPLMIPEYLTAPAPCYISLQSALYLHGIISQIPQTIYAVSLSRTRKFATSLGTFSIHHIQPDFFFGFEPYGSDQIKLATPEKALLDVYYLTPAKSRLFAGLPEIEPGFSFNKKLVCEMAARITDPKRKTLIQKKLLWLGLI